MPVSKISVSLLPLSLHLPTPFQAFLPMSFYTQPFRPFLAAFLFCSSCSVPSLLPSVLLYRLLYEMYTAR
ncbi:hypothetical protein HMPREF1548_00416 [Clostridium sp. KLE 1755]|nr:hypothetical protein HMPREF1548_00416 [Clostridium sp. KLE 1755]